MTGSPHADGSRRESRPHLTVVVDATCAGFGGIATYVNNLLAAWPLDFPGDRLHVLAPLDVLDRLPGSASIVAHPVRIPAPAELMRPVAQTRRLRALVREVRPDVVLATLSSTTLHRLAVPVAMVIYDLRHEIKPAQFSTKQRLLRRISYGRGYAVADAFIAISQRSMDDLHRLHPATARKAAFVVHLAADHVDSWVPSTDPPAPYAVTFGHHSNKNIDLIIGAWAELVRRHGRAGVTPLRITGLSVEARARVTARLRELDLVGVVELAPFLAAREFETQFADAALVVFVSDFEGFGLPVVEAMRLGKAVVVGPDPAVLEVAGGNAFVIAGWSEDAIADSVEQALAASPQAVDTARRHAADFTWSRTVQRTRDAFLELAPLGCGADHHTAEADPS